MKRDLRLMRDLLLALEKHNDFPVQPSELNMPGQDWQSLIEHLKILESGGLITGKYVGWKTGGTFLVQGITYAGHDYIETIRNDGIFNRALSFIKENSFPATLSILKDDCAKLLLEKL